MTTIEKGPSGRIKGLRKLLADLTVEDIEAVLKDFSLDTAALHGFSESTDYDLLHGERRYPPKAVLGLAAARSVGRPLTADEFSGGTSSPSFKVLETLGYQIVPKAGSGSSHLSGSALKRFGTYDRRDIAQAFEPDAPFTPGAGRWGISGIVETPKDSGNFVFIVTLGKPAEGNPYQDALTLDGYLLWESQTQQNFQSRVIQKFLAHDPGQKNIHLFVRPKEGVKYRYLGPLAYFSHDPVKTSPVHFIWRIQNWDVGPEQLKEMGLPARTAIDPAYAPPTDVGTSLHLVKVPPPRHVAAPKPSGPTASNSGSHGRPIDWAERDLRNRHLGLQGEKLVLGLEVATLASAGRADLAAQVSHVALRDSAAGYDIASYRPDGRPKRIEVKTTQGPASTPFYISLNEVIKSREFADSYVIYRVFDLKDTGGQVKYFELAGDVESSCSLMPVSFRAYPGNDEDPL